MPLIEGHRYLVGGREYESVTTILKNEGLAEDLSRFIDPSYAIMGRNCHAMADADNTGGRVVKAPADCMARFQMFKRWKKEVAFTPIESEKEVVHPLLNYAGTLDMVGEIAGELWLIDLKFTSARTPAKWHEYQTAMYEMALKLDKKYHNKDMKRGGVLIDMVGFHFWEHKSIPNIHSKAAALCVAHMAKIEAGVKMGR